MRPLTKSSLHERDTTLPPPSKKGKRNTDNPPDYLFPLLCDLSTLGNTHPRQIYSVCEEIISTKSIFWATLHRKKKHSDFLKMYYISEEVLLMLNLWLNGEQETIENWQVQMELIKIRQAVLPQHKKCLPKVIDIVHCLDKKVLNKPRSTIILFSTGATEKWFQPQPRTVSNSVIMARTSSNLTKVELFKWVILTDIDINLSG